MEVFHVDGLEGHGVEERRAVDEDVDLRLPRFGVDWHFRLHRIDNLRAALRGTEVGAHGDGLDIMCFGELGG